VTERGGYAKFIINPYGSNPKLLVPLKTKQFLGGTKLFKTFLGWGKVTGTFGEF
jgi:hypothetical protein